MTGETKLSQDAWGNPKQVEEAEGSLLQISDNETASPFATRYRWFKRFLIFLCAVVTLQLFVSRRSRTMKTSVMQAPPFVSRGELELHRLAQLRENRMSQTPSLLENEGKSPGVALVFLTIRGVRHRTLWQRWFEDAYTWLEDEGLETGHNRTGHRSDVIRAYVHHPYWLDPALRASSVPPALRPGIVENPVDCTWAKINPCFHRALQAAVEGFAGAEWFYMVASDAVPVKSFAELYTSLTDDPRTRLDFAHLVYDSRVPKVANWVLLRRSLVSTLVSNPQRWINEKFRSSNETHWIAGADEWAPYLPLLDEYGENLFSEQHPGIITLPHESRPLPDSINMFACWGGCEDFGKVTGHLPPRFTLMTHTGFAKIRSRPTVTHARKFDINTTVYGCPLRRRFVAAIPSILKLEKLSQVKRMNILPEKRATAGRDRRSRIAEPTSWSAANFGPFHSKESCSVTDFLSWKLNLKSIAEEEEEKPPYTQLPGSYQSWASLEAEHLSLIRENTYGIRSEILLKYKNKLLSAT